MFLICTEGVCKTSVLLVFLQQHVLKRERFVEPMLLGHAAQVCNVLAIVTDLEVRDVFEP